MFLFNSKKKLTLKFKEKTSHANAKKLLFNYNISTIFIDEPVFDAP